VSFLDLLEQLDVPRGRTLYVQSSAEWVQRAGFRPRDVIDGLTSWTGSTGTLVMPAYPFSVPHRDYLETSPTFDVLRSPASTGLICEVFRRSRDVVRSLEPDFAVCAAGADANAIAGGVPADPDPFGSDSSYHRLLERHAVLVGLGVSLNTSSFIHAVDSNVGDTYPVGPYDDCLFETTVIDANGRRHRVLRRALRPEFQQLTRPSAVIDVMRPAAPIFATTEINGARFFRWELDEWLSWCVGHARAQAADGRWPCWLAGLADRAA
jgi:aminoglycoside N3'-acetyltransferase